MSLKHAELRAKGLCVDCRKPTGTRKARCKTCSKKLSEANKKRRKARIAAGFCPQCGKNPVSALPSRRCPRCEQMVKACPSNAPGHPNVTREARRRADACVECGGEKVGDVSDRCDGCLAENAEATKARRDARIAAGLCPCGRRLAPNRKRCRKCLREHSMRGRDAPLLPRSYTVHGEQMTVTDIAEAAGMTPGAIRNRMDRGQSAEEAMVGAMKNARSTN